jgi:hypothetical protein
MKDSLYQEKKKAALRHTGAGRGLLSAVIHDLAAGHHNLHHF